MRSVLYVALGMIFCSIASADYITQTVSASDIKMIRSHTTGNPAGGAPNTATIIVENFHSICQKGVWLDTENDSVTLSFILAAYMAGKNLELRFNTAAEGPWGDSKYCGLAHVSIVN